MRIISWNVNGLNACANRGSIAAIGKENADIYCFQEVKASREKMPLVLNGYNQFHSYAEKKGYSGVSIFSKEKPLSVVEGIGNGDFDREGRVITAEFEDFFMVNAYFPHANRELARLEFKLEFNRKFREFCKNLERMKPIVIASDFNVAHKGIDLANPRQNEGNAGFTRQEREWFDSLLKLGFIDTFREFNVDAGHYTWWPYMNDARSRNIGWRIDYFVVSGSLKGRLISSKILKSIHGSDHCPIALELS